MVLGDNKDPELLTEEGVKFLAKQFSRFGARRIKPTEFPANAFATMRLRRTP